jgi:exonuclease VII large subunit
MRSKDALVRSVSQLTVGDIVEVQVNDGLINANVIKVKPNNKEQNYA